MTGLLAGRYELAELIGRGGVGDVYRAFDTAARRTVAIKFLRDTPGSDPRRFAAEVHTLERFDHPNLVRLLDIGDLNGLAFLVTDLVDGPTLARHIAAGALPPAEVARIGAAIAAALDYVHRRGVVHRDVKPANILLGREGEVRLADFGIARLVDAAGFTTTGMALGTPAYLAPEQVESHEVGPAADIYSLGLVLLEGLTGRRAFEGTAAEAAAQRLQRGPDMSGVTQPGWRFLLRTMTALAPASRPPAAEVNDLLASLAGHSRPDASEVTTERFRPHLLPLRSRPAPAARVGVSAVTEQIELAAPPQQLRPQQHRPQQHRQSTAVWPARPAAVAPARHEWSGLPAPPANGAYRQARPPTPYYWSRPPLAQAPAPAPSFTTPRRDKAKAERPAYVDLLIALIFVLLAVGIIAGYVIAIHATNTIPPFSPGGSTLVWHPVQGVAAV